MSTIRKIYPNTGGILFDGGLNTRFEKTIIPDNESPDCLNVEFSYGAVGTRQGSAKYNSVAVGGSYPVDGLYTRHDRNGNETMCVWVRGDMFTIDTTATMVTAAQDWFSGGARIGAAEMENNIFFGDGSGTAGRWDGSSFYRHGLYAPVSALSARTGAGPGVLSGVYNYKYTYINSNLAESDLSPISTTLTVAGPVTISMTNITTAPASWGVDARKLYRTISSGTTFFLVTTISDNVTTSYVDNTSDASLTAEAPTDKGTPPTYNAIIYHQSRLFMNDVSNPSYVWYTDVGEPYGCPSTNFIVVGDGSQDLVRGFGVHDNSLYIFCKVYTWILYMPDQDETNWVLVKAKSAFGSRSPYGIVAYHDKIIFPAAQSDKFIGFAAIKGDTLSPSATFLSINTAGSELSSDKIEPDMEDVQDAYSYHISSIVFKDRVYVSLPSGLLQTTNNRIYLIDGSLTDLSKRQEYSWSPWTGIEAAQMTIFNDGLYFGHATNGFIYQMENGTYNDDGAAIDSYYWTKEYSGYDVDVNFSKDFRYCSILVDTPAAYNMSLCYRLDSDGGVGNCFQVNLSAGGFEFGDLDAIFGVAEFGAGTDQKEIRQFLGPIVGRRIQYKFSNQNAVNQRFRVHRMTYAYNLRGYR